MTEVAEYVAVSIVPVPIVSVFDAVPDGTVACLAVEESHDRSMLRSDVSSDSFETDVVGGAVFSVVSPLMLAEVIGDVAVVPVFLESLIDAVPEVEINEVDVVFPCRLSNVAAGESVTEEWSDLVLVPTYADVSIDAVEAAADPSPSVVETLAGRPVDP